MLPSLTSIVLCTDFVNDDVMAGALHVTREHYSFEPPDFANFLWEFMLSFFIFLFLFVLCFTLICFIVLNFDVWGVLNIYVPFTILKLVYRYFSNSWKNKFPNYFDFDLFVWNRHYLVINPEIPSHFLHWGVKLQNGSPLVECEESNIQQVIITEPKWVSPFWIIVGFKHVLSWAVKCFKLFVFLSCVAIVSDKALITCTWRASDITFIRCVGGGGENQKG